MAQVNNKKKIFDGRYEILSIVGRGSESVVYLARHLAAPHNEVALKVLINRKGEKSSADRLRKEALAMVSSRHKNVIRLDDFHTVGNICYLAMEYAPYGDLRQYLKQQGGLLPLAQIERFMLQTAEALAFIHQAGILHRDIKPDNILIVNDRQARLGDFGVALLPGEESSIEELQSGVGTMDYMSPEILLGKDSNRGSDVYLYGVTWYEIITGIHPFAGISLARVIEARHEENIRAITDYRPETPAYIVEAVTKALRFESTDRYHSARELHEDLLLGKAASDNALTGHNPIEPAYAPAPTAPLKATPITVVPNAKAKPTLAEQVEQLPSKPAVEQPRVFRTRASLKAAQASAPKGAGNIISPGLEAPSTPVASRISINDQDPTRAKKRRRRRKKKVKAATDVVTPQALPITEPGTQYMHSDLTSESSADHHADFLSVIDGSQNDPHEIPDFGDIFGSDEDAKSSIIPYGDVADTHEPVGHDQQAETDSLYDFNESADDDFSYTEPSYKAYDENTEQISMAGEPDVAPAETDWNPEPQAVDTYETSEANEPAFSASAAAQAMFGQVGTSDSFDFNKVERDTKLYKGNNVNAAFQDGTDDRSQRRKLIFKIAMVLLVIFSLDYIVRITTHKGIAQLAMDAVSAPVEEDLIPKVTASELNFPNLPAGLYFGNIVNLIPGATLPLSVTSLPNQEELILSVGLNGWVPARISLTDLKTPGNLMVRSNGYVLLLMKAEGDKIEGSFENVISKEKGSWALTAVR